MSDPIPSAANETTASTSAEDRKAAAALSSLNTTEVAASSDEPTTSGTAAGNQPSSADQEALGKAMSRLEIAAGSKSGSKTSTKGTAKEGDNEIGEVKKKAPAVKVAGEDVTLLVNELDMSKVKATELLKANEGDAKKAIRAFIRPAAVAV
ncbi:hypothetical protein BDV06DRAFT_182002 [Aspergillus oleicola]